MNTFLTLAFLFCWGAVSGWVLELLFRHWFSITNPEHRWINPGFLTGPYLPIYGFGLCALYLLANIEKYFGFGSSVYGKIVIILCMGICMTVIEYAAGIFCLKIANVRLWDYSRIKGNVNGLICPRFSLIWTLLGGAYYLLLHPHIKGVLNAISGNLMSAFILGVFYGVFVIDVAYSTQLVVKIRRYAKENDFIVRYEQFKANIRKMQSKNSEKVHFILPFRSPRSLAEELKNYHNHLKEWHELERVFRKKK